MDTGGAQATMSRGLTGTGDGMLERLVRDRFGHSGFRPGQREVVEALLAGRDCLAVLPTGGGKSLIYQLAAVASGRCALVISPLVALMRDQVASAQAHGLRAASVDSALAADERARVLSDVREGRLDLLLAAPEGLARLSGELAGASALGLVAVDEAHCISQWGHDFRPEYRALPAAIARLAPSGPTLAVTATATLRVQDDITASLGLRDPFVFRGAFFRPNLRLSALRKDRVGDPRDLVRALLASQAGAPAIVYRLSRAGATSLAVWLRRQGIDALAYHAGLDAERRSEVQDAFVQGRCQVVVATVAFGMGVDKGDVRLVVHAELPDSLESYAQEIGRAGRDGGTSDCVLLHSWSDVRRRQALSRALEPERRQEIGTALREMYRFASGRGCRHQALCLHFGERLDGRCGACDACGAVSALRLLRSGGW